jgi:type VI secretion system VgrG family protein
MAFANQAISFHSDAVGADTLIVKQLSGHEQLSGMFRFELELLSQSKELKLEEIVAAPARIGIKQKIVVAGGGVGSRLREFGGVLTQFEQHEEGQGWVSYRATMVPKVSELQEFWRSRIFQSKSAPQIVKEVLADLGLGASAPKVFGDFHFTDGIANQMRAPTKDQADYPKRTYVVQYEESDWDFLARWLEHEGIYFFFENKDQQERIVFSDSSPGSEPVSRNPAEATFRFRPQTEPGAVGSSEEEVIAQFLCRQTRAPKEVALNDYNWRDAVRLSTVQKVDDKGVGLQTEYNDHYKNADQGKALAKVRKEELLCRTQVFHGISNSRAMRPGRSFTLDQHYRADWNQDYLLVAVEHSAQQSINLDGATVTGATYENSFTAIPLAVPFRPERLTEWPSIKGVMHGKVDAAEGNEYADLDEDGCYTVRIPYDPHFDDEKGAEAGSASRRMRMAQPFSGMDAGFHFPLRKGTEVILTHIDGDPDRPIIAGAVPNAETGNVGQHDESRNRIVSNTGNRFEIHDTAGATGFMWKDTTGSVVEDQRHRLGGRGSGGSSQPSGGNGGAVPGAGGGGAVPERPARGELRRALERMTAGDLSKAGEDLPAAGAGMAMGEESVGGAQGGYEESGEDDPAAALETFRDGDAVEDIRDSGSYVTGGSEVDLDPSSGLALDDLLAKVLEKWTKDGPSIIDPATRTPVTGSNAVFNWVATAAVDIANYMTPNASPFAGVTSAPAGTGDKDTFLDEVNNFSGSAFGSVLKIFLGDQVSVSRGNAKYTFGDVSNDISYGTGGYSFHEEDGTSVSDSVQYGNSISRSHTYGDSNSSSWTNGNSVSYSETWGHSRESSFFYGTKIGFSFKLSAETDTSVTISATNSNSLKVGVSADLSINVGYAFSTEISAAGSGKIELKPKKDGIVGGWLSKISFPKKDEIDVTKMKLALDETQAILKTTTAAVKDTTAALSSTQAKLSETQAALSKSVAIGKDDRAALKKSAAILSLDSAALAANEANLTANRTAASSTSLSGAHIIS